MTKPSQSEIDQLIQYTRPTNRDLVRRDINQAINAPNATLLLKILPFFYPNGTKKELLCLHGTVLCRYRGSQYNIPIEICLQQDHPNVPPIAYVRPTSDMYISSTSRDVQTDGTVIIPYLRNWRHPFCDLVSLINAMSEAFSQMPPVYAASSANTRPTSYQSSSATPYPTTNSSAYPPLYPSNPTPYPSNPVPYPVNPMPYPTGSSMPMPSTGSSSYSYPQGYPQTAIPDNVFRDSIQSAVLNKVRYRLDEAIQLGNAQIDSMKKVEQDLLNGEKKIQSLIDDAQQQQIQAQNHIVNLRAKMNEISETPQKSSSSDKDDSIKDDALIIPAPVYKQLLQAYAEDHAIQDLLYYLADGLRRESIGLDTYLKHVRELSRKQFMLRAMMQKCRQTAGLPIK